MRLGRSSFAPKIRVLQKRGRLSSSWTNSNAHCIRRRVCIWHRPRNFDSPRRLFLWPQLYPTQVQNKTFPWCGLQPVPLSSNTVDGLEPAPRESFILDRVENSSEVVGCGAIVNRGDFAELKRMFVLPTRRGLGIGQRILATLEARASHLGLRWVMLETGVSQPEAIRLYERAGFRRRGPYGGYVEDALTVYMEKELA